ncbi:MAG TPA: type II toxin-antitoxin system VapC family toxin [Allosphingosinicella sp.]
MILLDTHTLLWMAEGDDRLGRKARKTIGEEAAAGNVIVSAISFWEMGMLIEKGRIALSMALGDFAEMLARKSGVRVMPVDAGVAIETANLPPGLHGDPCDRILVATARHLSCPLATRDRRILAYAAKGYVRAIDASR